MKVIARAALMTGVHAINVTPHGRRWKSRTLCRRGSWEGSGERSAGGGLMNAAAQVALCQDLKESARGLEVWKDVHSA